MSMVWVAVLCIDSEFVDLDVCSSLENAIKRRERWVDEYKIKARITDSYTLFGDSDESNDVAIEIFERGIDIDFSPWEDIRKSLDESGLFGDAYKTDAEVLKRE